MMKHYLTLRAEHNQWVNARLFDVAALLSEADYFADRGAFFGSVHKTLNHIVATDLFWMHRIDGNGDAPDGLGAVQHATFADTRAARVALDARIVAAVDGLDDAGLKAPIRFKARNGEDVAIATNLMVANLFNHETHHRGQVHAMLTAFGQEVPPLDFFPFLMATGRSKG
ncbi:MAG: DinB family protein [Proteobacteria bacterium]|nr:DinB family protein [Pseudomonadota bacterium]MDA1058916.1 DinB family protein [Pseudomonadota bacterium]